MSFKPPTGEGCPSISLMVGTSHILQLLSKCRMVDIYGHVPQAGVVF